MYCKKCGKFIGTDSDMCYECREKEAAMEQPTPDQYQPAPDQYQPTTQYQEPSYYQAPSVTQDTSSINLGKSIASVILAYVGFFVLYFGIIFAEARYDATSAIVCLILGLVPTILGFIFGLQSISNFKKTSHIRSGKRIPVLILGINGVVLGGLGLFFAFLLLIVAAMVI